MKVLRGFVISFLTHNRTYGSDWWQATKRRGCCDVFCADFSAALKMFPQFSEFRNGMYIVEKWFLDFNKGSCDCVMMASVYIHVLLTWLSVDLGAHHLLSGER